MIGTSQMWVSLSCISIYWFSLFQFSYIFPITMFVLGLFWNFSTLWIISKRIVASPSKMLHSRRRHHYRSNGCKILAVARHLYDLWAVTNIGEGLQNFGSCSILLIFEQEGISSSAMTPGLGVCCLTRATGAILCRL